MDEFEEKKSWETLASSLSLRVDTNFDASAVVGDWAHSVIRLTDFGAPQGTLILPQTKIHDVNRTRLKNSGFSASYVELGPSQSLNIVSIKQMLLEWGWTGQEVARPSWLDFH